MRSVERKVVGSTSSDECEREHGHGRPPLPALSRKRTCWRGPVLTHGKYESQKVSEFFNFVHKIFIL
jgi:hypothetical protein